MEEWFLKIFNKYIDDIYRLAYSYTHKKEDSDDITQKVFMKFYQNIDKIDKNEENTKKWLIRVTINECKDLFKSAWRKYTIHITDENENIVLTANDKEYSELLNHLNNLPKQYRIIFYLYYYMGYNTNEISKILNIKENTIRQKLLRGRKILKIEMEDKDE